MSRSGAFMPSPMSSLPMALRRLGLSGHPASRPRHGCLMRTADWSLAKSLRKRRGSIWDFQSIPCGWWPACPRCNPCWSTSRPWPDGHSAAPSPHPLSAMTQPRATPSWNCGFRECALANCSRCKAKAFSAPARLTASCLYASWRGASLLQAAGSGATAKRGDSLRRGRQRPRGDAACGFGIRIERPWRFPLSALGGWRTLRRGWRACPRHALGGPQPWGRRRPADSLPPLIGLR